MIRLPGLFVLVAWMLVSANGMAQDYPTRPLRMIVPWPPSGTVDILARPLGQKLSELVRQPVVIDNRPGANSIVGSDIAAKSSSDGYTMLVDNITGHAINATLYKKLPFDSLRDFSPVSLLASVTNLLVVNPSAGVKTVKELLALARAKPGQLNYASFGTGSTAHLAGELFKGAGHVDMVHIPYKGGAPALADVMAGRATMMFATLPSALGHVKGGKLIAVATTGAKRAAATPNVPTVAESGLPGFEATTWYAALFPSKTPAPTVQSMNRHLNAALNDAQLKSRLTELGFEVQPSSAQVLARHMREEAVKWGKVVKSSGAQID
ncbi:MAG: tripartite tricarboxylate transporter substrate binding protein [Betaproteobacteria bacterium]